MRTLYSILLSAFVFTLTMVSFSASSVAQYQLTYQVYECPEKILGDVLLLDEGAIASSNTPGWSEPRKTTWGYELVDLVVLEHEVLGTEMRCYYGLYAEDGDYALWYRVAKDVPTGFACTTRDDFSFRCDRVLIRASIPYPK